MVERRNYWTRASVSARIVKWLKNQGGELPPDDPTIVERVLKWLAVRGLARNEGGIWKPTPPLVRPAPLRNVKEEDV